MRFALLTLPAEGVTDSHVGGKTRPQLQAEFAMALGCKRFLILCQSPGPVAFELQSFCEDGGAKVQLIRDAKPMLAAVKAEDELLVISPGVVPLSQKAAETLHNTSAVLAIDADDANAQSYERIDINHRWAGALSMPGKLVAKVGDLPEDGDLAAGLLRIALQGHVPLKQLPGSDLTAGVWSNGSSDDGEGKPVGLPVGKNAYDEQKILAPSAWIAVKLTRAFGSKAAARGITPTGLAIATGMFAAIGVTLSLANLTAALLLLAFAWIACALVSALEDYIRTPFSKMTKSLSPIVTWLIDIALLAVLIAAPVLSAGMSDWPVTIFAALSLVAMIRIASAIIRRPIGTILTDRALICIAITLASIFSLAQLAIFGITTMLLLLTLWATENNGKDNRELTQSG